MNKKETEHSTTFTCCEQDFQPGEPIRQHLKEAHGLADLKGTKKLVLAMDGDEYVNVFELEIGGVKLTKTSRGPKEGLFK